MANPEFTSPEYTFNVIDGIFHCTMQVDGEPVAKGVGDTEYQAKRNAVVTYRNENPSAFLDIPD